MTDNLQDDTWIFGYGSLIWRVDFPFAERRPAYITDFRRMFWQGSTDHRGVPGAPGRVVTLIEAAGAECWGMAYCLATRERDQVMEHLDYREKGGYARLQLPIYFADGQSVRGITYHATEQNPNFLGEATALAIAAQIAGSTGPSGHNIEYLMQLEQALAELGAADDHVVEVAMRVREILAS